MRDAMMRAISARTARVVAGRRGVIMSGGARCDKKWDGGEHGGCEERAMVIHIWLDGRFGVMHKRFYR